MYRIYDKQEKRWRDDIVYTQAGYFIRVIEENNNFSLDPNARLDDELRFVLVRSTGLKDKSGEMIWELDRLEFIFFNEAGKGEKVVKFIDGVFSFERLPYQDDPRAYFYNGKPNEKWDNRITRLGSSLDSEGK